jgi:hypothetical protein
MMAETSDLQLFNQCSMTKYDRSSSSLTVFSVLMQDIGALLHQQGHPHTTTSAANQQAASVDQPTYGIS